MACPLLLLMSESDTEEWTHKTPQKTSDILESGTSLRTSQTDCSEQKDEWHRAETLLILTFTAIWIRHSFHALPRTSRSHTLVTTTLLGSIPQSSLCAFTDFVSRSLELTCIVSEDTKIVKHSEKKKKLSLLNSTFPNNLLWRGRGYQLKSAENSIQSSDVEKKKQSENWWDRTDKGM